MQRHVAAYVKCQQALVFSNYYEFFSELYKVLVNWSAAKKPQYAGELPMQALEDIAPFQQAIREISGLLLSTLSGMVVSDTQLLDIMKNLTQRLDTGGLSDEVDPRRCFNTNSKDLDKILQYYEENLKAIPFNQNSIRTPFNTRSKMQGKDQLNYLLEDCNLIQIDSMDGNALIELVNSHHRLGIKLDVLVTETKRRIDNTKNKDFWSLRKGEVRKKNKVRALFNCLAQLNSMTLDVCGLKRDFLKIYLGGTLADLHMLLDNDMESIVYALRISYLCEFDYDTYYRPIHQSLMNNIRGRIFNQPKNYVFHDMNAYIVEIKRLSCSHKEVLGFMYLLAYENGMFSNLSLYDSIKLMRSIGNRDAQVAFVKTLSKEIIEFIKQKSGVSDFFCFMTINYVLDSATRVSIVEGLLPVISPYIKTIDDFSALAENLDDRSRESFFLKTRYLLDKFSPIHDRHFVCITSSLPHLISGIPDAQADKNTPSDIKQTLISWAVDHCNRIKWFKELLENLSLNDILNNLDSIEDNLLFLINSYEDYLDIFSSLVKTFSPEQLAYFRGKCDDKFKSPPDQVKSNEQVESKYAAHPHKYEYMLEYALNQCASSRERCKVIDYFMSLNKNVRNCSVILSFVSHLDFDEQISLLSKIDLVDIFPSHDYPRGYYFSKILAKLKAVSEDDKKLICRPIKPFIAEFIKSENDFTTCVEYLELRNIESFLWVAVDQLNALNDADNTQLIAIVGQLGTLYPETSDPTHERLPPNIKTIVLPWAFKHCRTIRGLISILDVLSHQDIQDNFKSIQKLVTAIIKSYEDYLYLFTFVKEFLSVDELNALNEKVAGQFKKPPEKVEAKYLDTDYEGMIKTAILQCATEKEKEKVITYFSRIRSDGSNAKLIMRIFSGLNFQEQMMFFSKINSTLFFSDMANQVDQIIVFRMALRELKNVGNEHHGLLHQTISPFMKEYISVWCVCPTVVDFMLTTKLYERYGADEIVWLLHQTGIQNSHFFQTLLASFPQNLKTAEDLKRVLVPPYDEYLSPILAEKLEIVKRLLPLLASSATSKDVYKADQLKKQFSLQNLMEALPKNLLLQKAWKIACLPDAGSRIEITVNAIIDGSTAPGRVLRFSTRQMENKVRTALNGTDPISKPH
ncbi:MAG: hypothetical protein ACHQAX_05385 [Gammaproteobacteria bacterium]